MKNQANQLVPINKVKVSVVEPICKINISGYSLDHYKTFNPDGYTILCRLGETSGGLTYLSKTSKIAEDFGISQQDAIEKSVNFFFE